MENLKVLINKEEIKKREKELAEAIEKEYKGKEVVFICILKGAVNFMVHLLENVNIDVMYDFIDVSSYSGTESTGQIILNKEITQIIEKKDIIIIEDIIDTGRTIKYLKEYLQNKKANSIKVCTLLDKKSRRVVNIQADYVGFEIEDKFVVGYGLDYNEKYRKR